MKQISSDQHAPNQNFYSQLYDHEKNYFPKPSTYLVIILFRGRPRNICEWCGRPGYIHESCIAHGIKWFPKIFHIQFSSLMLHTVIDQTSRIYIYWKHLIYITYKPLNNPLRSPQNMDCLNIGRITYNINRCPWRT